MRFIHVTIDTQDGMLHEWSPLGQIWTQPNLTNSTPASISSIIQWVKHFKGVVLTSVARMTPHCLWAWQNRRC